MIEVKKSSMKRKVENSEKPQSKKVKSAAPQKEKSFEKSSVKPSTTTDITKKPFKKSVGGEGKQPFKKPFKKSVAGGGKQPFKKPFKKDFKQPQQPQESVKTNWNELKQKKKDLKVQRRKNKSQDLYDIDVKAKKIYEELKQKSTKANKEQLCEQLHSIMKNADYSKLSLSPDRARIIQTLLKKAPQNIKHDIAERVIPHIVEVALSKYGKFCVSRLMTYCGKEVREKAVSAMFGNIAKLTTHNFANGFIDMVYLNHASPEQKLFMKQELYSDLYKNNKNKQVKTLKDTWEGSEMLKNGIVNSTKMNLTKLASKNLIDNSLVHAVLLEFIEEAGEQERNEIITAFIPHLAAIASTKQGSRAAVLCYLYSVAKERRAMLKAIKEHVTKLATHEHGHLLILEILNSTDDTLNIKKTLFASIISDIETIASNEYGKRVILFIVAPTKEFFHPKELEQFDSDLKLGTQKKDIEIRRKELVEGIEKDLCEVIRKNPKFWLKGGHTARVTIAVLQNIKSTGISSSEVYDALCVVICDPEWMVNETEIASQDLTEPEVKDTGKIKKKKKNPIEVETKAKKEPELTKGIEHSGLHIAIKKIAKLQDFATSFVEQFSDETLDIWIGINRACFVLNEVIEHADDESKERLKSKLTGIKSNLAKKTHAGAKVLLKKL